MQKRINQNVEEMFPYYVPEELKRNDAYFSKAYELHINPRSVEDIVSAVRLYHGAFVGGCLEAGTNILSIIFTAYANGMEENPTGFKVLENKVRCYVDELLKTQKYSKGLYYAALAMIYDLYETGSDTGSVADGWELMDRLVKEQNPSAIVFTDYLSSNN